MPDCCKEAAKEYIAKGMSPGAALAKAMVEHKKGQHQGE